MDHVLSSMTNTLLQSDNVSLQTLGSIMDTNKWGIYLILLSTIISYVIYVTNGGHNDKLGKATVNSMERCFMIMNYIVHVIYAYGSGTLKVQGQFANNTPEITHLLSL